MKKYNWNNFPQFKVEIVQRKLESQRDEGQAMKVWYCKLKDVNPTELINLAKEIAIYIQNKWESSGEEDISWEDCLDLFVDDANWYDAEHNPKY